MVTPTKEKIHQAALLKYFGIYPTVAKGSLGSMQVDNYSRGSKYLARSVNTSKVLLSVHL